ncbi:MAG: uridylate kinase [Christensenellales bacterium]
MNTGEKMASFDFEMVGKIGSMALIRREDNDIDHNRFSRLGAELRPGMIWVTSGATEIGRLDYLRRSGRELIGDMDDVKADYASQGQSILMENYRRYIKDAYGIRQVLVEHQHFNDPQKREFIRRLLLRAAMQNAIPIVNYNDSVSFEENRRMELADYANKSVGNHTPVVECVDNDETAAVICTLVRARILLIMTSVDGIYEDVNDRTTLINEISGKDTEEVLQNIEASKAMCVGASRTGANGARAKLEFITEPVKQGTKVIIGNAKYKISELIYEKVPCTVIGVR